MSSGVGLSRRPMSQMGHSRPGRAISRPGYVRYGPTTTKLFSAAACRDGPRPEIGSPHSMTLSARLRIVGEMVRPIAFAVLRLMSNSNVVGSSTGSSPGLAPLRILVM